MRDATARPRDPIFELSGGALCLDFANTWGDRARPESDRLTGYPALLAFAAQAAALGHREVASLGRQARRAPAAAGTVVAASLVLREALYRLFAAQARGRRVAAGDLGALNRSLEEALPHLRVAWHDGSYRWEWGDAGDLLAAPLWPIARSAADLLADDELDRVRECDGASCTWLFLDHSRNRSRRWCSMESCGNRAKARRHYHRQHATAR